MSRGCQFLTKEVKNVVTCSRDHVADVGDALISHPQVSGISFTGSTEVGRRLIEGSARNITRLSMELGGHAPVLVFDDAPVDAAAAGAEVAKFRNTGQSCIAANRIYVQRWIFFLY